MTSHLPQSLISLIASRLVASLMHRLPSAAASPPAISGAHSRVGLSIPTDVALTVEGESHTLARLSGDARRNLGLSARHPQIRLLHDPFVFGVQVTLIGAPGSAASSQVAQAAEGRAYRLEELLEALRLDRPSEERRRDRGMTTFARLVTAQPAFGAGPFAGGCVVMGRESRWPPGRIADRDRAEPCRTRATPEPLRAHKSHRASGMLAVASA